MTEELIWINAFGNTKMIEKCNICPQKCGAFRRSERGQCGASEDIEIAHIMLHSFEEPFISGTLGSGAIFFAHCSLKCVYCQNYKISRGLREFKKYSINDLAQIYLSLESQGAHNINLVTPTHYTLQIIESIVLSKKRGLKIPIIWNTSGYESVETIRALKDIVDIYLTDFKYYSNQIAKKYSNIHNYFEVATSALEQMFFQTGKPQFSENQMMKKGIVVRHLVLPHCKEDSKAVIEYLYRTYGNDIYLSIMNQFTPTQAIDELKYPELLVGLSKNDYDEVVDFAADLGVVNALIQEDGTNSESFIPPFEG